MVFKPRKQGRSKFFLPVGLLSCVAFTYFVFISELTPSAKATQQKTQSSRLILISLDGFRYDYINTFSTPNLNILAKHGVHMSEGIIPVFPTYTWPNHQSIVTGVYPETHGIVGNTMRDPDLKDTFYMGNNDPEWWNESEPVWITARQQGLKTGVLCWPGASVKYNGIRSNYYVDVSDCGSYIDRVNVLLQWILNENVNFVAMYFDEPDLVGHSVGPDDEKTGRVVEFMDDIIGYLLLKLINSNLLDSTDLIVTTDHGMALKVNATDGALDLSAMIKDKSYALIVEAQSMAWIRPAEGKEEELYTILKNAHSNVTVYTKKEIPEEFHHKNHRRIAPIIILPDEGYAVVRQKSDCSFTPTGNHGFNPKLMSMRGLFVAVGPSFKIETKIESFELIHLYSLICGALKIEPNVNANSSLSVVKNILRNG